MKIYIFATAYNDSGVDLDIIGIYKNETEAKENIRKFFIEHNNYPPDEADDVAEEIMYDRFYEEEETEDTVEAVYRLEVHTI